MEAVGPRLPHDVTLAAQDPVAFETGEVAHVPRPALRLGALVGQYQLSIVHFLFSRQLNLTKSNSHLTDKMLHSQIIAIFVINWSSIQ